MFLVYRDMLVSQLKQAEQERQQISSELHARFNKIDMLRKRYVRFGLNIFYSWRKGLGAA